MNLIFNAYAYISGYRATCNLKESEMTRNTYYKCAIVSLFSAKTNNLDCEVAFITNVQVPEPYLSQFKNFNITIIYKDFNEYIFDKDMKWSLAFYKLCALKYAINNFNYDNYLMLDTDTFINKPLIDLWQECNDNIMLFDMGHSISNSQATNMNAEYYLLYGKQVYLTNYGGEFICGSKNLLLEFINEIDNIYALMIKKRLKTQHGDEFLICLVANKLKIKIKNASPYVYRYWTQSFYLVSTNYKYNPVCIFHLPSEKNFGFNYTYRYIIKNNKLPESNRIIRYFGLPNSRRNFSIFCIFKRLFKKINKFLSKILKVLNIRLY